MSTSAEIEAVSPTRTKRRALARVSPRASVAATLACGALLLTPGVARGSAFDHRRARHLLPWY